MSTTLNRRTFLAGALAAGAATALPGCSTPGSGGSGGGTRQLTVSAFGGDTQELYQEAVYQRLQNSADARVTQVSLQSDDALARMIAEAEKPVIDLYQFSGGQERTAVERGLTADLGDLGGANLPPEFIDPNGQWVAPAVIAEGIAYNADKIEKPTSYRDFLNPDYRGHIAFPTITNGYGVDFLVMLARTLGGGIDNIDPGFEALAELAKHATIFSSASEMQTLFAQGDVWLMPYDYSNTFRTAEAGLPVEFAYPKEGSPAVFITHTIAAETDLPDLAREAVATSLSPAAQADIAELLRWIPTNPATKLPGDLAEQIPVGQEALDQLTLLDRPAIEEHRDAWTARFNREVASA
jgi:putative spermidine/putrescine transport system substrate-binding protein